MKKLIMILLVISATLLIASLLLGQSQIPTTTWVQTASNLPSAIAISQIGTAGLSGTSPVTINSAGAIACATCVTSAASLTSTALVTGAGSQASQTPSATSTLDSSGNLTVVGKGKAAGYIDTTVGYLASAMGSQSTATCTNVTNMTWNISANKNYTLSCEVPITFAASATVAFCLGGPGTATSFSLEADGPLAASAVYTQISTLAQTVYGTKTAASGVPATTAWAHVKAQIQNGATASGTALTLQTAANGTNNIPVLANAACTRPQAN